MSQFDIQKFDFIDMDEVVKKLRCVKLLGHGLKCVYQNAKAEIENVSPLKLVPTQRYVLSSSLKTIENLYVLFNKIGIDIFNLDGGIRYTLNDKIFHLLPPIIEMTDNSLGGFVPLICDGMHRIKCSIQLNKEIRVICFHNLPPEFPYYAHPLPNGWKDVRIIDRIPPKFQKKVYREPNAHKLLFRDINSVFPGIQFSRK